MRILFSTICIIYIAILSACNDLNKKVANIPGKEKVKVYAKEPNDSADYKFIKYDFYLSKSGQLCERKRALARDTICNCEFEVYYDSTISIYKEDTVIVKSLKFIIDVNSFENVDSTEYSKDKNKVYYFESNSDGGNRLIVDKADPSTFNRLCDYRWGIDKNYVFHKGGIVDGLNLKYLQILYPPDKDDHFIEYIKDDKNVFYEYKIVKGADLKSFKVVSGQKWDAEDKKHRYMAGRRLE